MKKAIFLLSIVALIWSCSDSDTDSDLRFNEYLNNLADTLVPLKFHKEEMNYPKWEKKTDEKFLNIFSDIASYDEFDSVFYTCYKLPLLNDFQPIIVGLTDDDNALKSKQQIDYYLYIFTKKGEMKDRLLIGHKFVRDGNSVFFESDIDSAYNVFIAENVYAGESWYLNEKLETKKYSLTKEGKYEFAEIIKDEPEITEKQHLKYEGTLGEDLKIFMDLYAEDSYYYGKYRYQNSEKELLLYGSKGDECVIKELNQSGKEIGVFKIKINENSAEGYWNYKTKNLEVKLNKVSRYPSLIPHNIDNIEFKNYLKHFARTELPYDYTNGNVSPDTWGISEDQIKTFIDSDYETDIGLNDYGYGFYFVTEKFIATVVYYTYMPGAFGIYNEEVYLITYDYSGRKIAEYVLAANYNDSNMGGQEIESTIVTSYIHEDLSVKTVESFSVGTADENMEHEFTEPDISESYHKITEKGKIVESADQGEN